MVAYISVERESGLLQRLETFYRVNNFVSSIDNLDELLDLIMREAEGATQPKPAVLPFTNRRTTASTSSLFRVRKAAASST